MPNHEQLLEKYLEGVQLTQAEIALLEQDPQSKVILENAQQWQGFAKSYQDEKPFQVEKVGQLHQPGPSWMHFAMAASFMVLAVLCGFLWQQNHVLQQGLLAQQQQLNEQQQNMQLMLANLQNSQEMDTQFAQQLLATNRAERTVVMNELLAYLETQRKQDQAVLRLQLNELAEQVEHYPAQLLVQNGER